MRTITQIRIGLLLFIAGLFISGVTAFPLESELKILTQILEPNTTIGLWIFEVYIAVSDTNSSYPYLSYGTDWLAFAHLLFAVLFIGPLKKPIQNIWVIEFGIIACIAIFPLALIAGSYRQIPFFHQLIDCAFGVIGLMILMPVYLKTKTLKQDYEAI